MGFLREPSHLIIVGLVVVVLFGSRRLPEAARGLGQAMKILKTEMKDMQSDKTPARTTTTAQSAEAPLEGKVVPPQTVYTEPVRETPRNV